MNMDTILVLKDTVSAHVIKVVDSCPTYVHEAQTNWADVQIVFLICMAIVLSILIVAVTMGILIWHNNSKTKECDILKEKCVKSDELHLKVNNLDDIKNLKEKVDKLSRSSDGKEEYEIACEVLDKISSLARPKDGITDEEVADKLFSLYKSIKSDIYEKTGKTSSEG